MLKEEEIILINNLKQGDDTKIFSYLYKTTLKKVRGHILKNNGTHDEANDVFQDAVIILLNHVRNGKWDTKYDLDGFMFSISKNLWIDKVRKDQRKVNYQDIDRIENESDFKDQLSELIDREKSNAVRVLFEKLDEKCRAILNFVMIERLSMKEISQKMGYSSEDVAKTRHYKCKQYLTGLVKGDVELVKLLRN